MAAIKVPKPRKFFKKTHTESPSIDTWLKEQEQLLERHILDGKPLQTGTWPIETLPSDDMSRDWGYIGIGGLLSFYNQYVWPETMLEWRNQPTIQNLAEYISLHLETMHEHKGRTEYLPSLAVLIKLKAELSKKKNLPKKRKL